MSKKGLVEFIKLESIDTGMWKPFRGEKTTNVQWQLQSTIITESALNKTQFISATLKLLQLVAIGYKKLTITLNAKDVHINWNLFFFQNIPLEEINETSFVKWLDRCFGSLDQEIGKLNE